MVRVDGRDGGPRLEAVLDEENGVERRMVRDVGDVNGESESGLLHRAAQHEDNARRLGDRQGEDARVERSRSGL